jgi:hypothetical protein
MAFREVLVTQVKEVLRAWLAGAGKRPAARRAEVDVKTAMRYIKAARAAGLVRDGDQSQLADELLGAVVAAVRPPPPGRAGLHLVALHCVHPVAAARRARSRLWIADDRGHPGVDGCPRVGLVGDSGDVSPELPRPGGVFSRAEARRHGYDEAGIRREVRTGRWVRLRHGIYAPCELAQAAAEDPRVAHALALAAELGARAGLAAGSHESAAWLHELSTLAPRPTTASLTVVRGITRHRVGVVARRAALPPHHLARVLGVPVTSAARTVVDLARERPFADAVVAADSALRFGAADRAGLRGVLADCQRWPGIRSAIDVVDFADPRAESALESLGRMLCRDHRLPRPDLQVPIADEHGIFAYGDLGWPHFWTIAECDGLSKYADPRVLSREKLRQERIEQAGWEVVRMTWHQVTRQPEATAARIRDAISRSQRRRRSA